MIERFNATYTVTEILTNHGYERRGRRFLAPASSTGLPGVVLLEGRAYSHHGADPLANGHAHDAFSLFTLLAAAGDVRRAVKIAAKALGMAHGSAGGRG